MPSKKINSEENKKKINLTKKHIIIIIVTLLLLAIVGTFAWLTWKSRETALVLTVGDVNQTQVTLKPYQIDTEISPVLAYENEEYVGVTATNKGTSSKIVKLFYQIKNIDSELVSTDFKYTITKSTDNGVTYTEYLSGNFSTASNDSNFYIMEEKKSSNTTYKYRVYVWLDGNNSQSNIQGKSFEAELRAEIEDAPIITVDTLINLANPSTLMYANATDKQKGEMWTFSHDATEQVGATTDYRYIGNTPNNYITFNNEMWRIIGVFDGRIKIIRNEPIGDMPFDAKRYGVGSAGSTGTSNNSSNDWTDSQLMYMLNPTSYKLKEGYTLDGDYIKDASGNIIYQLGCKPASINKGAISYNCTANTWNLNSTSLSQISEATYYLGGTAASTNKSASAYYSFERGKSVYNSVRQSSWTGLVGLMYPSDFAYTFANGVNDTCYNDTYSCVNANTSWLYNSKYQWTISPYSSNLYDVFVVDLGYRLHVRGAALSYGVRPVVYLKSDIKLTGSGTSTEPYEVVE